MTRRLNPGRTRRAWNRMTWAVNRRVHWQTLVDYGWRPRLTVYEHEQCYGGAEEGGWWYDTYTPTRHTKRVPWFVMRRVMDEWQASLDRDDAEWRPRWWFPPHDPTASDDNWGARHDEGLRVRIDGRHAPRRYPTTRPHYE